MSHKSIIGVLILFFLNGMLFSQDDSVKLVSMKTGEKGIEISFSSEKGFIVGAERYVLHIGDYYNAHSKHPAGDKHSIVFTVDKDAFDALGNLQDLVLVYGLFEANTGRKSDQSGDYAGRHWRVGKFDRNMLDK
ncbi:MAG: hypothetical protein A2W91_13720 [Bacteroidetes bacterium GWF2_38_335]|nr:MAG: hypothetical protein A2W91_13720 [Bacteroidetes bacterium GWF2_38_335]OFY77775.1 MAG: hypothetical protein A2281_15410 [Bacteroidetes bacterium RIFOXYA12_FULL_38_20]HBS87421.1 hypothetical protein [Bacteroidales bacterium]